MGRKPLLLSALLLGLSTAVWADKSGEKSFLVENDAAMNKMMAAMAIRPSGDIDRDFAAMMIPHHQGAIDMARAELQYGHNELLKRIAQEIVVEQQQEITAMNLALDPVPAHVVKAPVHSVPTMNMPTMNMNEQQHAQ